MLTLTEIFVILIIHWVADFVLQTDKQAKGKSKEWKHLLQHTFNYSVVWYFAIFFFAIWGNHFNGYSCEELGWSSYMILFPIITFIAHTITDYFTSRWVKKYFNKGNYHMGFVIIGIDQYIFHIPQLFLTYYYLKI